MKGFLEILEIEKIKIIDKGIIINDVFLFEGSFYFRKEGVFRKIEVLNLEKNYLRLPYEVKLVTQENFKLLLRLIKRLKKFKIKKTKN